MRVRGGMRAAWAYFVSFQQAARDFARLSQTKLTMPVLSIGGEKANGAALGQQVKLVATNARSVTLPNTGHWVMEENPQATMDALVRFSSPRHTRSRTPVDRASTSTLPQMRLTPAEVRANQTGSEQIGSSGLAGVSTKVLFGDPSKRRLLHDRPVGAGEHDHPGAFASRRSDGGRRVRHVAVRVWRSLR